MSTGTQAVDAGKKTTPKRASGKTKSRRRPNTVTAKRFFDLVVLVLAEKTGFTSEQDVPMQDVQDEVLKRADLTAKERTQYDDKYLRRRIEFAFRNRKAGYVKGIDPLTVQTAPKQWALTDAGVAKAQELASSTDLPPEPVTAEVEVPEPEVQASAPEPEVPEPEVPEVEASAPETTDEKPKTTRKRKKAPKKKAPRSISEATS